MLHGPKETQRRAKQLRRAMSLPEVLLWRELRKRSGDLKFRRQHPAGPYILDFFCAEARLAVEVDGEAHSRGAMPERDRTRDTCLRGQGIRVCRVRAEDVLRDLEAVVTHVVTIARRDYTSTAFGGPPPPPGED